MGVLNVTPDSFSDGGFFLEVSRAVSHALKMEREGADLIDVGGESSRPGARPISAKEEIRRVRPVLRRLAKKIKIPLSIDTYKTEVAHAALDEGAVLVNDIHALKNNRALAKLIARYKAAVVLMHMQGLPRTMQQQPSYGNLLKEIADYLSVAMDRALDAGIQKTRIAVDPGFGFGKTPDQNLEILASLRYFLKLKAPLLVGLSRKSFIGYLSGTGTADRLPGSLGAAAVAIERGAHILRVHDVLAHRQLTATVDPILSTYGK